MLTLFDFAVLLIIALSALRGMWRGLVAEVFALVGWVAAIFIAVNYAGTLAPHMPADWPGGSAMRWGIACAVIAIGVLVLTNVLSTLLNRLTHVSGLGSVDHSLGLLFGLARGALLVSLLVLLAQFTHLPRQKFWQQALLRPYAEHGARILRDFLPKAPPPESRATSRQAGHTRSRTHPVHQDNDNGSSIRHRQK